jgi:thiosulfate/3-mercaptopyruvate sulfurtransferase
MSTPLIDVEELASSLSGFRVCDLRWDLTDPAKGRADYESGHIPGAVFVDLDRDLAAPPSDRGRHPLPDITEFAATLGKLGVDPEVPVVAYDDAVGRIAARLWWMLRSVGHESVYVLDGGFQAWVEAGKQVEIGTVSPEPSAYQVPERFRGVVNHDELYGRTLVDAREAPRYRGEIEPVDPKAGHIPGAINIPTSMNVATDGRFLNPAELAEIYSGLPPDAVVSCGSGVTACHDALAMVIAGHDIPDVYVGSFSEWSRRDLPVAAGP